MFIRRTGACIAIGLEQVMSESEVKNIVFDIGNVVVRWDPSLIAARTFTSERVNDDFVRSIFGHEIWYKLNRGELSENEAKSGYCEYLGLDQSEVDALFFNVKDTQELIEGTTALMARLSVAGYRLFALTDNVHEIVAYLKRRYDFWDLFNGAAVSAELGCLKPSKEIYNRLLLDNDIKADETVFFDDIKRNVEGANKVGIRAFQFTGSTQAEADLKSLYLDF